MRAGAYIMPKPNGYVLHETPEIVVIATGFSRKSKNPKTGDMIQVWILNRQVHPVEAVRTGADSANCLDCKLRGKHGKGRLCYVRVGNAPANIWLAYQRGNYPYLGIDDYARAFSGRKIRFGAYGEPVLIPLHIIRALAVASDGHTGYTHQWRKAEYLPYSAYILASVDTETEYLDAKRLTWRTFRVRSKLAPMLPREISCPASAESGHKTTCADCRLCSGTYRNDPRKDVSIIVHGLIGVESKFQNLIQIGGVAA
jgi:hypothetical protein